MKDSGGFLKEKVLSYKTIGLVLVAILSVAFFALGGLNTAQSAFVSLQKWFAAGDVPAHEKTLTDNHDGTHKLELSVTGDADTEIETASNVNVLVIFDTSSSMENNNTSTGVRRSDAAEKVVYDFATSLYSYQSTTNPNNIQMALVTFDSYATTGVQQNWTSTKKDITDKLSSTGNRDSRKLKYHSGTNWEAGLRTGINDVLSRADNDPTFVLFVTDGAPYRRMNAQGNGQVTTDMLEGYQAARDEARTAATYKTGNEPKGDVTFYGIYAYGSEGDYLDDLVYYALNGSERATVNNQTQATPNYYNASDTPALTNAIESIFQQIIEALGVSSVSISDGTTANVQTTTGEISHLLSVDQGSYQYWLSIPVVNNQFSRIDLVSGETVTYTVRDNNNGTCTVTWGTNNSVTVNGQVSGGQLKYEWTAANALYDKAPPTAVYNSSTGAVDWNLNSVGTLLDGVTYSVTFDVFPSQETYDMIADLKNEKDDLLRKAMYDNLDTNVKKYLEPVENSNYTEFTLKTNTTATLSYRDTRNNTSGSATYDNPEPVGTDASTISIHKEWKNNIPGDPRSGRNINVNLQRDGEYFYPATLTGPDYSLDNIYIATGLARLSSDGVLTVLDAGHDYKFAELGSESYNWELDTETVHPMLINNVPTKLIKIETSEVPSEMGESTYYNDGENDYYHLKNDTKDYGVYVAVEDDPNIKAINNRRSNLNITKTINTSSQQSTAPTDKFTFTINVDMKDDEGKSIESKDNTYHNDYLWFSVAPVGSTEPIELDEVPTNWQKEDGANYYYAPNGTSLVIEIPAGYNIRFTNLPTNTTFDVTEGDLANYVLENFVETEEYEDETTGETVTEEIQKVSGSKKISGTIAENNRSYTIEATNKYEKVDIEVEKDWQEDDNGSEGLRTSIDVALKANGTQVDTCTLSEATNWKCSFTKDRFANEREITYTVEELTDLTPHYITTYDGFKIINTRNNDDVTTKASVLKVWDDDTNHDGFRPQSLRVQLNDEDETVVTLTASNNWRDTVENLPKYKNGQEITYTWTELNLPAEYTLESSSVSNITENNKIVGKLTTITNKHESVYIDIPVEKVWLEDNNNAEGLRTAVEVELFDGEESLGTKTLNTTNQWKDTYLHLPKYRNGQAIDYELVENTTNSHYTTNITQDENGKFTVTNTRKDDKTIDIPVEKKWVGDNGGAEGLRTPITVELFNGSTSMGTKTLSSSNNWKDTFTDLPKYANGAEIQYTLTENYSNSHYTKSVSGNNSGYIVTNTRIPEDTVTKASVLKVWDDDTNHDGFRPQSLRVQLNDEDETVVTLSASNNWRDTVEGLPKYKNGQEITYTWTELNLPAEYTLESSSVSNITENNKTVGKLTTITNKHESVYIDIPVEKVWLEDDNNAEGLRTAVEVELFDGEESLGTKTLNTTNQWKDTYLHLPKYRNGQAIDYELVENTTNSHYTTNITQDENGKFTVTNTRKDDKTISIPVEKKWVGDNDGAEGLRTPITVELKNGNQSMGTKTLSSSNNWKDTFTDLPKYANGEEIEYTLTENYTNSHYRTGSVVGDNSGFTVTNTRIPEDITISYTVNKIWDDVDDQDGIRPDSITVTLVGKIKDRDSEGNLTDTDIVAYPAEEVTVSKPEGAATNKWSVTVENLPKYADGQLITYSISEDQLTDYDEPDVDGNTVTNPHNPFETKVTVIKKWDDKNNQDGLRDEVTFMLTNKQGLLIPGASKDVTFKLTDENVDSEGNWVTSKEGLPRRAAGEEIEYSVVEIHRPEGYTAKDGDPEVVKSKNDNVTGDQEFTITYTNVHKTKTVDVLGVKEWDDDSNRDVVRPQSIYITLTGTVDGEVVFGPETKIVTSRTAVDGNPNQWAYSFTDLDEFYDGGKTITYTITETDADGNEIENLPNYKAPEYFGENNYSVRNSHTNEPTNLSGKKVWKDDGNRDVQRPDTIRIEVYDVDDPSTIVDYTDISGNMTADEWSYEFTGLNKYKNVNGTKTPITYKVKEVSVPDGYTSVVGSDGKTITNTYTPEKTSLSGKKVWNDDKNRDALRPSTITIEVYDVDDPNTIVDSTDISGNMTADEWSYEFTGLNKYKNVNGTKTPVTYKVKEVNLPDGYTSKVEADGKTITNTHVTEKVDVPVTKTWIDSDDKEKHRPTEIIVYLFADDVQVDSTVLNDGNDWEFTFEQKPANKNVNGVKTPITYRVEEEITQQIRDYYDVDVVNDTSIVNTIKDLSKNIPVYKIWNDANNQDGKRDSVTITLSGTITDKDNNVIEVKNDKLPATITLTKDNAVQGNDNEWFGEFTDVPIFYQGTWITYQITESGVDNTIYTGTEYGTRGDAFTVTNTHEPQKAVYTAKKVWDDHEDNDDRRPDNVTFALMANGSEVQRLVASEENEWKVTFTAVPVYKEGAVGDKINYTITEPELDSNYTMSEDIQTGDTEYDFIITNEHEPMTISYKVTKIWDDFDNQSGDRPDSITVRLYESTNLETPIATQVITADSGEDGWTYTFEGLPKYRDKQLIQYVITEDNVDLYKEAIITQVEQDRDTEVLTNSVTNPKDRVPYNDTGEITVNKYWKDEENKYKKRPKSVTIELLADGEVIATADLSDATNWSHTFTGLWKYKEGEVGVEIVYSIRELEVEYYKTTIDGFDVYNTYNGPEPEITPPNTGVMMVKDNNNNVLFEMIATLLATSYTIVVAKHAKEQ